MPCADYAAVIPIFKRCTAEIYHTNRAVTWNSSLNPATDITTRCQFNFAHLLLLYDKILQDHMKYT